MNNYLVSASNLDNLIPQAEGHRASGDMESYYTIMREHFSATKRVRQQVASLLRGGEAITPTEVSSRLKAYKLYYISNRDVNILLCRLGYQTRTDTYDGPSYSVTERSIDLSLGITQGLSNGRYRVLWNPGIVELIASYYKERYNQGTYSD